MNVIIIEDHPLVRFALKHMIHEGFPKAVVQMADTFPAGLNLLATAKSDILILDIEVPGGENIRMIDMIRKKQPNIVILIHSGHDEEVYALPYLQAGADGYISKTASSEEFQIAFRAIADQGKYVSYNIQQSLLRNIGSKSNKNLKNAVTTLSPREMRVMELLVEGKWTKEISIILNLKENTISTYKRRIFDKLKVADQIELAKKVSLIRGY
ncbi:response regulator transcription factor [Dyadobacter diqingensis]|uniref:response regulator transcription factor n=1 Tax=Dyadobacter diqingensis TaxID=2938121 RepID=UPI0020C19AF1|nr:response regulator transcription factor [Dyadobacter diqingensis]